MKSLAIVGFAFGGPALLSCAWAAFLMNRATTLSTFHNLAEMGVVLLVSGMASLVVAVAALIFEPRT